MVNNEQEEEFNQLFSASRRRKAQKYNQIKKKHNWIYKLLVIVGWAVFFYFSFETGLYSLLSEAVSGTEIRFFSYLLVLVLLFFLLNTLWGYIVDYQRERKFNLSSQKPGDWLKDNLKGLLLNLIITLPGARLLLYFLQNHPRFWWLYFSLLASIFLVIITFILPKVLLPLFFTLKEYPPGELRERLMGFISQINLEVEEIYEINLSSKINYANAAVVGLGQTRKILLGDNLADNYSNEEIEAILAHELAHHVHGDLVKNLLAEPVRILFSSFLIYLFWPGISSLAGYGETGVYVLPLLMVCWSIIYFLTSPLQLYFSRQFEWRADQFALAKVENPRAFAVALARLADESLQQLEYSLYEKLFIAAHPAPQARIRQALYWPEDGA